MFKVGLEDYTVYGKHGAYQAEHAYEQPFIVSIWVEQLLVYNLIALAALMIAALLMHVKVKDPIKKSYPALSILFMIALIMYFTLG